MCYYCSFLIYNNFFSENECRQKDPQHVPDHDFGQLLFTFLFPSFFIRKHAVLVGSKNYFVVVLLLLGFSVYPNKAYRAEFGITSYDSFLLLAQTFENQRSHTQISWRQLVDDLSIVVDTLHTKLKRLGERVNVPPCCFQRERPNGRKTDYLSR